MKSEDIKTVIMYLMLIITVVLVGLHEARKNKQIENLNCAVDYLLDLSEREEPNPCKK